MVCGWFEAGGQGTYRAVLRGIRLVRMEAMFRRSLFRFSVVLAGLGLAACSMHSAAQDKDSERGRNYKAPPPSARIEVSVVRDASGKPIEDAAVVFHPMEGERDRGGMELKTNEDGKTVIDVIPIGDTVRVQVIARGFQTYGQDYKVNKAEMSMEIRLKRPAEQYSIYKTKDDTADSGKSADGDKSAGSEKGGAPAAPPAGGKSQSQPDDKANPQGSPKQAEPEQSQPQANQN